jgi:hypothetical protein
VVDLHSTATMNTLPTNSLLSAPLGIPMPSTSRSITYDLRGVPKEAPVPYAGLPPTGDLSPAPWSAEQELSSAASLDGALLQRSREASDKLLALQTRIQHAVTGRPLPEVLPNLVNKKAGDLEEKLEKILKERNGETSGNPPRGFFGILRSQSTPFAKDLEAEQFLEGKIPGKIEDVKATVAGAESLATELADKIEELEKFLHGRAEFATAAVSSIDQLVMALDKVSNLGKVPGGMYNVEAMEEMVDKNLNSEEIHDRITELKEARYRLAYLTYIFPWLHQADDAAQK